MLTATFAFLSFKMLENRKKIINKPEVPTDGRMEQFVEVSLQTKMNTSTVLV